MRRPGAALFCEVVAALVSMLRAPSGARRYSSPASCRASASSSRSRSRLPAFGAAVAALAGISRRRSSGPSRSSKFPPRGPTCPCSRTSPEEEAGTPSGCCATGSSTWADGRLGAVLAGLVGWLLVRALARAGCSRRSRPVRSTGSRTLSERPSARRSRYGPGGRGPRLTWRPFGRREPVLRTRPHPATGGAGPVRRPVGLRQVHAAARAGRPARDGRRRRAHRRGDSSTVSRRGPPRRGRAGAPGAGGRRRGRIGRA